MKNSFRQQRNKPATLADLDDLAALIISSITRELQNFATKDDLLAMEKRQDKRFNKLEDKVEELDVKTSDIHRRTRDLEGDTAGLRQVANHEHRIKKLEVHVFAPAQ